MLLLRDCRDEGFRVPPAQFVVWLWSREILLLGGIMILAYI